MPPIFKNVQITIDNVGPFMKKLCEKLGEFKTPRHALIASYFGKKIMLTSQILQWYMISRLVIENVTAFIKYSPISCFKRFIDEVINARRKANKNTQDVSTRNTAKLIGSYRCQ